MISQLQIRCCFSCMSFFLVGKIFQVSLDCFFFGNIYRKTPYFLRKKTRFPVKLFQTRPTHHPNHIQKQGQNLHLNCEHSKPGEPRGTLTGTLVGGKFGDGTANYTGWFIWIPLLGSVIPYNHQATRVLNTAKIHGMLRLKKTARQFRDQNSTMIYPMNIMRYPGNWVVYHGIPRWTNPCW